MPPAHRDDELDGPAEVVVPAARKLAGTTKKEPGTYNSNTAVVTSFVKESSPIETVPIAEVTEDPSTNQAMPGSGRKTT